MGSQKSVCIYTSSHPTNRRWCFSAQKVADEEMLYLEFNHETSRRFNLKMQFFRNLQKVFLYNVDSELDCFWRK